VAGADPDAGRHLPVPPVTPMASMGINGKAQGAAVAIDD